MRAAIDAAADDSVTRIERHFRLRRHDGAYRWCIARGTKLRSTLDARPVWYGAVVDVHDLRAALEQAQSADKAKAAFLATTSHELRTPLNSIIGFTSLLLGGEMGPLLETQQKPLEVVQRSSQQLLRLVQDVLDFTAIEAGHLKMDIAPTPLSGLLGEVRDQLTLRAAARGVHLPDVECDEGLAAMADAGRLSQVVLNLVANGVTYTDRGFVRIAAAREGRFARIDVTDSGIGIPAAEMHKLFQPFQPIQRSDGSIREGTGLGLAITRRLVESMDGEVGCSSEPGVGSRFWIKVPLAA
jgi:signal transduction histidine kinase